MSARTLGPFICCVCDRVIADDADGGRNPDPFPGEQCCKQCDRQYVLPIRVAMHAPDATVEIIEEMMLAAWTSANPERAMKVARGEDSETRH
jgi:hypothetical protein